MDAIYKFTKFENREAQKMEKITSLSLMDSQGPTNPLNGQVQ